MTTCLTTMASVYAAACAIHVTIFSTGGKFRLVSNFIELHTLTLATRAYVFLVCFSLILGTRLGLLLLADLGSRFIHTLTSPVCTK